VTLKPCLNGYDPYRYRADLALVELHRVEIRLQEASEVTIYQDGENIPFESWTYDRMREPLETAKQVAERLKEDLQKGSSNESNPGVCIRQSQRSVKSRTQDAMRYLDLAEPMLRERRRNVWWTTWFFQRRRRAIALIL